MTHERLSSGTNENNSQLLKPFSPAASAWGWELLATVPATLETQSGMLGIARTFENPDAITVLVAPLTDVSDKQMFPDEVDGEQIVYLHVPLPEEYKG